MSKLNSQDIVEAISRLDQAKVYPYVSGKGHLKILSIQKPNGPIKFQTLHPDGQVKRQQGSISVEQIATIASVCTARPNYPLHVDRVFSAGGNSRSALETLLVYTPNFFVCYPQRLTASGDTLRNLKHIMWCPDESHEAGRVVEKEYTSLISEMELALSFDKIDIASSALGSEFDSIEAKRTHVQMQIAIVEIGKALGFKTWVAQNDQSIQVGEQRLGSMDGVIRSLEDIPMLYDSSIRQAALFIDCVWFTSDGKHVPAVIEIEHSTGITSGATRMRKFYDQFPSLKTKFVILADEKLKFKAQSEAVQPVFHDLNLHFLSYSTVRELYGLVQRYPLRNAVDHRFIEPFLERLVKI